MLSCGVFGGILKSLRDLISGTSEDKKDFHTRILHKNLKRRIKETTQEKNRIIIQM